MYQFVAILSQGLNFISSAWSNWKPQMKFNESSKVFCNLQSMFERQAMRKHAENIFDTFLCFRRRLHNTSWWDYHSCTSAHSTLFFLSSFIILRKVKWHTLEEAKTEVKSHKSERKSFPPFFSQVVCYEATNKSNM